MKNETLLNRLTREEKKAYAAPKIESISSVRKATKGGLGNGSDNEGYSKNVSDPNGNVFFCMRKWD